MLDRALSSLIGEIYEAALDADLWPHVMRQMSVVAPCAIATFYSHDLVSQQTAFEAQFGADPTWTADYVAKWSADNPLIAAMMAMLPGDIAAIDSLLDYEAFEKTPFFQLWGRPQGFVDAANIMLERTPTRLSSVSLIRHERHGRVDKSTLARLEVLAPHFLRSARIAQTLSFATIKSDRLSAAIDALAAPVIVFDARGTITHANSSGTEALKIVPAGTMQKAVASSKDAVDRGRIERGSFILDALERRFFCHWTRLRSSRSRPADSLLVIQRDFVLDGNVRALAREFGLTSREAEIAFFIVGLGGVKAVASSLDLSKETIKTHLRNIFSKTGVHNQIELLKLLSGLTSPLAKSPQEPAAVRNHAAPHAFASSRTRKM